MSFDELSTNVISRELCTGRGDFSAELAYISCSGVGVDSWTSMITTSTGANLFYGAVKKMVKVEPAENSQNSTKLLVNLSRMKRSRINSYPMRLQAREKYLNMKQQKRDKFEAATKSSEYS